MSALVSEIAAVHAGRVDGPELIQAFRTAAVLVPVTGDSVLTVDDEHGIRWVLAFTDRLALAQWARLRGEGDREVTYRSVFGWRLLDVVIPALGGPAGVAVDVGSSLPLLLPPVRGVVPTPVAVDRSGRAA